MFDTKLNSSKLIGQRVFGSILLYDTISTERLICSRVGATTTFSKFDNVGSVAALFRIGVNSVVYKR